MIKIINILAGVVLLIVAFEFVQGSSMEYWGVFINENKSRGYFLGTILLIGASYFFWRGLKAIDKEILFRYLKVNFAITAGLMLAIYLTGPYIEGPLFTLKLVLSFPGFIFLSLLTGINNVMHFATDKTQLLADGIVYASFIGIIQVFYYKKRQRENHKNAIEIGRSVARPPSRRSLHAVFPHKAPQYCSHRTESLVIPGQLASLLSPSVRFAYVVQPV